jgi:hypothetical protein
VTQGLHGSGQSAHARRHTEATSDEVKLLRQENERLKQLVADLRVANMLLKKSQS